MVGQYHFLLIYWHFYQSVAGLQQLAIVKIVNAHLRKIALQFKFMLYLMITNDKYEVVHSTYEQLRGPTSLKY